ncbi:flavocytochrome c [bacterium]|nr:flavocytochrome c [bacterium]
MDQKKKETKLTRRDFMKTTAGATAVVGIAASGLFPAESMAANIPKKWDYNQDVIVIGSGFAGLAAAIEAKNGGASVVVLEKMRLAGGNSIINGGVIAAAGSPMQEQKGIKDSPELMLKDMMKAGLDLNYPDLAQMVAEQSKETLQWTIDYLGVKYVALLHMGGHTVSRSHMTYNSSGSAIVSKQLAKLKELGVKIKTQTYLESFIQDKKGRVIGLKIREGYKFPNASSGKIKYMKANKGVVLATGGFSRDVAFRITQDPKLVAKVDSTNQPGATADAFKEALRIGATPVQQSWIQLGPWASPDEKGFGLGPHFASGAVFTYGIMVDPKTGKRFVSELADRKVRADAIIKTGNICIGIADDVAAQNCGGPPKLLEKVLERGVVKKYNTLQELCAAYDMPYQDVKESVDNYNTYLKDGEDKEFGRFLQKDAKPIEKAPFYAMRLWPKVHHTMGGLQINKKAEVIGLDQKPIKGLYAAGEAAGGVHGAVRLGSCAVTDCLVFGRIAGKSVAAG